MMSVENPSQRLRDSVTLVSALLLVHIFLIVNSGLFADDWLLFAIKSGYPVQTDFLIHGAGHPFLFLYVTLANLSGHPVACMKILALAGIVIGALNLRSFLLRLSVFSEFEAVTFSFLVWSYGGYQNWATKLLATYVFSFGLLCLGLNLLSIVVSSDRPNIWLRLSSLAALFCSFSLNSMIAAYGIGLGAIFLAQAYREQAERQGILSRIAAMCRRFPDFLVLPVIYWVSVNHFFPKIGPYENYYRPRIPSAGEILSDLDDFWIWGFRKILRQAIDVTKEAPYVLVLALVVGLAFTALVARRRDRRRAISVSAAIWPALAAIASFVICASPYLVSGLRPASHFFESQHLILLGIPLGFALVWAFRMTSLVVPGNIAGRTVVALLLTINLCALWNGYFLQQARWLRQEALIDHLRRAYAEPPATVFDLVDGFADYPWHTYLGSAEVTGTLHLAWDHRPLFGFTGNKERSTILRDIDAATHTEGSPFRDIEPWGPQATIELVPRTPVLANAALARSYYLCLVRACDAGSLIDDLVDVTVRVGPIPNLAPRQQQPD